MDSNEEINITGTTLIGAPVENRAPLHQGLYTIFG